MDTLGRGRPNFLFICCDHLRGDWLGCNGHPLVQTPQIDKFSHDWMLEQKDAFNLWNNRGRH